ncbi:DUF368 domain-containing protein [Salinibacterium sp. SYSU T00001]|uniref:DUF368 domain-containing protein n=1 Tax=Homoserinimonas sedimenticola TaxID=2986805 RepID=UPI002235E512|nr:DUF368 domain-containing protein [Salinibacterium sedimenticola]MCW4386053.1 DUF368 domain-containing protein [Salinibacterium sedimenticola]
MPSPRFRPLSALLNALRGALIGIAEIIPGVSGGTIALITGVYGTLIGSAGHLVRGVVAFVVDGVRRRGQDRSREHFAQVRWGVILPLAVGMFLAVVVAARMLAPLIEEHPEIARALFAGLIVTSLIVPARMVGWPWHGREWVAAAVAAVAAFAFSSIPSAAPADPPLALVALAAALAVCALVLPGVSGSFLLVIVGMYEPTLNAVNDRDFAYLGVFIVGAVVGLSLFVSALQWLLEHRRRMTLAIMTGLMVGSLRALWPWQTEEGEVLAPGDVGVAALAFLAGVVIVAVLLLVESRLVRRRAVEGADVLHPSASDVTGDQAR